MFTLEDGRVVAEQTPHKVFGMLGPWRIEEQAPKNVPWLRAVLDTDPMGNHGAVLDVKWLGWKDDESVPGMRAHAMTLLFWDCVIASVLFHDQSCGCDACAVGHPSAEQ